MLEQIKFGRLLCKSSSFHLFVLTLTHADSSGSTQYPDSSQILYLSHQPAKTKCWQSRHFSSVISFAIPSIFSLYLPTSEHPDCLCRIGEIYRGPTCGKSAIHLCGPNRRVRPDQLPFVARPFPLPANTRKYPFRLCCKLYIGNRQRGFCQNVLQWKI